MKNLFKLSALTLVTAFFAAGCTNDPAVDPNKGDGTTGSITIRVAPDNPGGTRALLNDNALVTGYENKISKFDAYVFDEATGFLEASVTVSTGTKEHTFTGITTAGTKRIVVIANLPETPLGTLSQVVETKGLKSYQELASAYVELEQQLVTDTELSVGSGTGNIGLLMTGETSGVTLTDANITNAKEVTVKVKRVVAKVELGSIAFDSRLSLEEILNFNLTGASIQKAVSASGIGTGLDMAVTQFTPSYLGGYGTKTNGSQTAYRALPELVNDFPTALINSVTGILNSNLASLPLTVNIPILGDINLTGDLTTILPNGLFSVTEGLGGLVDIAGIQVGGLDQTLTQLGSTLTTALSTLVGGTYWYVLPNADANNPTLLTLKGTYRGVDQYYPIEINAPGADVTVTDIDTDADFDTGVDGAALKNVFIQRNTKYKINVTFLNLFGSPDPDAPADLAKLKVTVEAAPWTGTVNQNVTW